MTSPAPSLRSLLDTGRMVVAPGAMDCITARLIQHAGFPAVYMTGAGTSLSLGYPDFGLITMSEMVANASRIVRSIDVPLISDADTGYGNELNVFRTVQEFERAGVSAIHIEDQVFPKRCGHVDDKEIVGEEDFIRKIRAAVAARRNREFLVIARTDARGVIGFEAAISRSNAALEAGADMAFVEAPRSLEEMAAIPRQVKGPCMLNIVRGGKSPEIDLEQAAAMGYAMTILPGLLVGSIISHCERVLEETLKVQAQPASLQMPSPASTFAKFGAAEWDSRRTAFHQALPATAASEA